jgi:hypothetical protein
LLLSLGILKSKHHIIAWCTESVFKEYDQGCKFCSSDNAGKLSCH